MTESPDTRPSLILRLQSKQDLLAWNEFVEIYEPLIVRIARNKGLQHADAAEIAQEVLVRVARSVDKWNPDPALGSFRGWLYRITRNLMVQFIRTRKRQPLTCDDSAIAALVHDRPDQSAEAREFDLESERQIFRWAATRIRGQFEPGTWNAFWLTAVENVPVSLAKEQLGMTAGAIYIARSRVMKRLREVVRNSDFGIEDWQVPGMESR